MDQLVPVTDTTHVLAHCLPPPLNNLSVHEGRGKIMVRHTRIHLLLFSFLAVRYQRKVLAVLIAVTISSTDTVTWHLISYTRAIYYCPFASFIGVTWSVTTVTVSRDRTGSSGKN
jgi:hypothetical protein